MLPHFGHFEPRWAPPFPPCEELRRTCRAVVASTGNVVSRGVPKRRAHVARRRELALMLRIESKVNERRGGATLQLQCFFVCLVCFKRGAAVLFGQGSGLNAFKVYISASCLSCINQDTLSCIHAPRATKTHDRTTRAADCPSKGARWTQVILRPVSYVSFLDLDSPLPAKRVFAAQNQVDFAVRGGAHARARSV